MNETVNLHYCTNYLFMVSWSPSWFKRLFWIQKEIYLLLIDPASKPQLSLLMGKWSWVKMYLICHYSHILFKDFLNNFPCYAFFLRFLQPLK